MDNYVTLKGKSEGFYTEKRSKFISFAYPCESADAAAKIMEAVKKEYFDARHHVYAYVLSDGTAKFGDDGEPHGTAGKPILDCILGSGIKNVLVVVIRYFGGILLGTGGLVKAYTYACNDALKGAEITEYCYGTKMSLTVDYTDYKSVENVIKKHSGEILSSDFTDKVNIIFTVKDLIKQEFLSDIGETFSQKLTVKEENSGYFNFPTEK